MDPATPPDFSGARGKSTRTTSAGFKGGPQVASEGEATDHSQLVAPEVFARSSPERPVQPGRALMQSAPARPESLADADYKQPAVGGAPYGNATAGLTRCCPPFLLPRRRLFRRPYGWGGVGAAEMYEEGFGEGLGKGRRAPARAGPRSRPPGPHVLGPGNRRAGPRSGARPAWGSGASLRRT